MPFKDIRRICRDAISDWINNPNGDRWMFHRRCCTGPAGVVTRISIATEARRWEAGCRTASWAGALMLPDLLWARPARRSLVLLSYSDEIEVASRYLAIFLLFVFVLGLVLNVFWSIKLVGPIVVAVVFFGLLFWSGWISRDLGVHVMHGSSCQRGRRGRRSTFVGHAARLGFVSFSSTLSSLAPLLRLSQIRSFTSQSPSGITSAGQTSDLTNAVTNQVANSSAPASGSPTD
jgi:hypothetical protein